MVLLFTLLYSNRDRKYKLYIIHVCRLWVISIGSAIRRLADLLYCFVNHPPVARCWSRWTPTDTKFLCKITAPLILMKRSTERIDYLLSNFWIRTCPKPCSHISCPDVPKLIIFCVGINPRKYSTLTEAIHEEKQVFEVYFIMAVVWIWLTPNNLNFEINYW